MTGNRACASTNCRPVLMRWMVTTTLMALGIASVHGETPPLAADRQAARADNTVRVGAEFFLNRSETADSVARHFRLMKEHGLSIARIFVIWDDIERMPGQWDFHRYDWVYDAAAANGIRIAATLCAEDPPGWMRADAVLPSAQRSQRSAAAQTCRRVLGKGGRSATAITRPKAIGC